MHQIRRLTVLGAMLMGAQVASAQQAPAAKKAVADTVKKLQDIEVVGAVSGRGRTQSAAGIDASVIRIATPGVGPLKLVERVPGVNVQHADAFAQYEWANRVTIRGFQTQQIGQTLDGITLGDGSYGNFNGLGVGRAVDPDNLQAISVQQGAGALGTFSSNNLGGVLSYTVGDPSNTRSFTLRQMVGEAKSRRTSTRFDTGLLPVGSNGGFKGFISLSRQDNDKWKGPGVRYSELPFSGKTFLFGQGGLFGTGQNWRDQLNAKGVLLLGPSKISTFVDYSDSKESDFADLSLARYATSGREYDLTSDWNTAKALATSATPDEAYWQSSQGARRDWFANMKGEFPIGATAKLSVTPYLHTNRGGGDWHAPSYGSTFFPDPIMFRQSQYKSRRYGSNAKLNWTLGGQELEAGAWYESNTSNIRRPRWRLTNYASGPDVDFTNVLDLDFDRQGTIKTSMAYVQNTTRLAKNTVKLTYGAKYLYVKADFRNNGNTPTNGIVAPVFFDAARPSASIPTKGGVLPQAGILVDAGKDVELFGNYAENVNVYPYSPGGGVYGTAPSTFDFFNTTAKPEKASTFEGGIRSNGKRVQASLGGYYVNYRNRLVGIAVCPPTATCNASFANVGNVDSRGIEALLAYRITPQFEAYVSGSYNVSTFRNDYVKNQSTGAIVATKGKTVPDAPKTILNANLKYNDGKAFGTIGGRSVSKRYFSLLNDVNGTVPSYTVFDASVGYRFENVGAIRDLTLQLNAANLFDKSYISTLGTNGFTESGDTQTLMVGTKRLLFFTVATTF